jgi:hypothetical protein
VVKFDEKTLAAEGRLYPFVIIFSILFLLVAILMFEAASYASGLVVFGFGIALFSAGIFWWIDRSFHVED